MQISPRHIAVSAVALIASLRSRTFGDHSRLVKCHPPAAIAIYKNIGAVATTTAHLARYFAPVRRLHTMHPGDWPANVDLSHSHRNAELVECWLIGLPVPLDRDPADVGMRIGRRRYQYVVSGAGPHCFHCAQVAC